MLDNKIICDCYNITFKDIKDALNSGASTFDEVSELTNAGQGCGHCQANVAKIIKNIKKGILE